MNSVSETIKLACDLINFHTTTPVDNGCSQFIVGFLQESGFEVEIVEFEGVKNVYAHFGDSGGKHLVFAGHKDVVPAGDLSLWVNTNAKAKIIEDKLYGRGVVDMKGAIAAFMVAAKHYLSVNNNFNGQISILITGDEEASSLLGMRKMLPWLSKKRIKFDFAIVGEPTSDLQFGDTIKIGRRGSINYLLEVYGKQGHVAYPQFADNPVDKLIKMLNKLTSYRFDNGNEHFQPTNCEITGLEVYDKASNVIPNSAKAYFNIRFGTLMNEQLLETKLHEIFNVFRNYNLTAKVSGEPFINTPIKELEIMSEAILKVTDLKPKFNTAGGTSDARFLKDYCPLVEFGLRNSTAHQINESAPMQELDNLMLVYKEFIQSFFAS